MDRKTRELAAELLEAKRGDPSITYADIARKTGYSERHLKRLAKEVAESGAQAAAAHGNEGRRPSVAASEAEVGYLREMKERYPRITIAQFRDIFIEDVIENPEMAGEVERLGLVARSRSWFADLFRREGWVSPAAKPQRAHGGRVAHPIRDPAPRRGMLVQVDATPLDWLGDGDRRTLHLAVDDATTEALAGSFMPRECVRGYARMAQRMVERHGVPEALYSDKHSVFVSSKGRGSGGPTQFARMMGDLGVRMITAGSPQAKGRVERYNLTAQMRLVNDIVRFGVRDYDQLDAWFNDCYIPYLNAKFAFDPLEKASGFRPLPEGYDASRVFRTRTKRVANGGMISYEKGLYWMVDADGALHDPGEGVKVDVYVDVWTERMYVERYGKRYLCVLAGAREHGGGGEAEPVEGQRELGDLLAKMRAEAGRG